MTERVSDLANALRERLLWGLYAGSIHANDRFPSTRQIAERHGVNGRTALRACQMLAAEGLLEMRPRSGTYVALGASDAAPPERDANPIVDLFLQGTRHGIPPAQLPARLAEALNGPRLRIAAVGDGADDASALCEMLSADFGVDAFAVRADTLTMHDVQQQIRKIDGVVATVFQVEVLRHAIGRRVPIFLAGLDPAQRSELFRGNEPRYVVAPRRWAERALEALEGSAAVRGLHFLIDGEDDLSSVPESATIYLLPSSAAIAPKAARLGARVQQLRYDLRPQDKRRLIHAIVGTRDRL